MNKPQILVVEDDTAVGNLITTTLETQNYLFHRAKTGAGALMDALSYRPDVILLDLGLPDMDGVTLIQKIRSWSNLPIIVISARSEDSDKVSALDAGADDYLTKPFSVEELLARLRVALRRVRYDTQKTDQEASVYQNGALKIDYAGGCAYRGEQEIHLTPIEYKLLCLLAKTPGRSSPTTISSARSGATPPPRTPPLSGSLWPLSGKSWKPTPATPSTSRPTSAWDIGCSGKRKRPTPHNAAG